MESQIQSPPKKKYAGIMVISGILLCLAKDLVKSILWQGRMMKLNRRAYRKHLIGFSAAAFLCFLARLEIGMWITFTAALLVWAIGDMFSEQ